MCELLIEIMIAIKLKGPEKQLRPPAVVPIPVAGLRFQLVNSVEITQETKDRQSWGFR